MPQNITDIKKYKQLKETLTKLESLANVDNSDAEIIDLAKKIEKKYQKDAVLKAHHYAVTKLNIDKRGNGKQTVYWQTRAPWTKGGKIRKASEDDLYDALYEHYYGDAPVRRSVPTVAEVFESWMKEREELNCANYLTRVHNRADWERYFNGKVPSKKQLEKGAVPFEKAAFIDKPITEVKASEIIRHYRYLVGDENITRKAFNNAKSVLNGVFGHAMSLDLDVINTMSVNTKDIVKRCRPENDNSDLVYSAEERKRILDHLDSLEKQTTYTLAVRLAFCLGTRIGELRALHWSDYDEEEKTLFIHRQMCDEPDGTHNRVATEKLHMKGRNNAAGKRKLQLSDYAVSVLAELRKLNGDKVYILNAQRSDKPISTNHYDENFKRICAAAGVRYLSSHKQRFTVATALFEANVDERAIQLLLGHASPNTTRHYDRRKKIINLNDDVLQNILGNGSEREPAFRLA